MTGSEVVRLRPRRARIVCAVLAAALFIMFALVGTALTGPVNNGPATFGTADQVAMIILGALGAAGIMLLSRPRVEADARTVRVRNLIGSYELPWSEVKAVRFNRGSPWASLELGDDDLVAMMAVQATDKDYAVNGVRALRALHAAATAPTTPADPAR
ncbi:MAG TPA: PH domain-containing protein [Pilimelia sp.]|nr:PH domain-containing protein [Pilimelia sp.]